MGRTTRSKRGRSCKRRQLETNRKDLSQHNNAHWSVRSTCHPFRQRGRRDKRHPPLKLIGSGQFTRNRAGATMVGLRHRPDANSSGAFKGACQDPPNQLLFFTAKRALASRGLQLARFARSWHRVARHHPPLPRASCWRFAAPARRATLVARRSAGLTSRRIRRRLRASTATASRPPSRQRQHHVQAHRCPRPMGLRRGARARAPKASTRELKRPRTTSAQEPEWAHCVQQARPWHCPSLSRAGSAFRLARRPPGAAMQRSRAPTRSRSRRRASTTRPRQRAPRARPPSWSVRRPGNCPKRRRYERALARGRARRASLPRRRGANPCWERRQQHRGGPQNSPRAEACPRCQWRRWRPSLRRAQRPTPARGPTTRRKPVGTRRRRRWRLRRRRAAPTGASGTMGAAQRSCQKVTTTLGHPPAGIPLAKSFRVRSWNGNVGREGATEPTEKRVEKKFANNKAYAEVRADPFAYNSCARGATRLGQCLISWKHRKS